LCLSLHDAREVLAWDNHQPLACSTLQGWGHQAAPLAVVYGLLLTFAGRRD
jgi:hypothetical protein